MRPFEINVMFKPKRLSQVKEGGSESLAVVGKEKEGGFQNREMTRCKLHKLLITQIKCIGE